ncbi:MAG: ATP-dependent zinc metalloprotease FtsH [bacterium]|nr:ATP-dependent zinc metalloprotease FtsH [bacterium]
MNKPKLNKPKLNKFNKTLAIWLVLGIIVIFFVQFSQMQGKSTKKIVYSQFIADINASSVKNVEIAGKNISGQYVTGDKFTTYAIENPDLWKFLKEHNVEVKGKPETSIWQQLVVGTIPFLLFIGFLWFFVYRQMQSGGKQAFSFGKSRAKMIKEDRPKITFKDVAGIDEAKEELQEIIEFLKTPEKFQKLGGKLPKGVLLMGHPGTGKTLLAKAVAGEAKCAFFSISGSDFVEMFVGVGASRVRDLFEQGKRNSPCLIFIDEIDAVGRQRFAGLGGGHDEREQTLNALLVEMDGFNTKEGVILIAATNRPDVLDPALLRPGRFDRTIMVEMPDIKGRMGILKVHTKNLTLGKDVALNVVARGTPGMSGADLENLCNEAAIVASRKNKSKIEMSDFEEARDKVMMGIERKSLVISDEEKKIIAYHEAGHTLVQYYLPDADPIHKVSIIPRGRALGLTHILPEKDKYIESKSHYMSNLVSLMGGRAAEILVFNNTYTGAKNDIRVATELARQMVCEWGMSEKLGPLSFGRRHNQVFLGRDITEEREYSEDTAKKIDIEVRNLVENAYKQAENTIKKNRDKLDKIVKELLEKEVIDRKDVEAILEGKSAKKKPTNKSRKKES